MPVIYMEQEDVRSFTEGDIRKLIELSNQSIGRYENLENYYAGKHKILEHFKSDPNVPNNKLINNMPKYITDTATGYFMGKPVTYSAKDESYMESLQQIFDYNDEQDETVSWKRNALSTDIVTKCFMLICRDGSASHWLHRIRLCLSTRLVLTICLLSSVI